MRRRLWQQASVALAALLWGCSDGDVPCAGGSDCSPSDATLVAMDFTNASGFYGSPFPSDARVRADGTIDLEGFPNPRQVPLVDKTLALLRAPGLGFGLTSGVFFQLSGPIDPARLPDLHASVGEGSPVVLVDVDRGSPSFLARHPISSAFLEDGGPFGAPDLLALLPLQGMPLRARGRYAAVVRRELGDASGRALGTAPELAALVAGEKPAGMSDAAFTSYRDALDALAEGGVPADAIAGLAVFATGAPTRQLEELREAMLAAPAPAPSAPFALHEVFDDFCVYESTIPMPVYQAGTPPYDEEGGGWTFDENGVAVLDRMEEASFVVTVPRRAVPPAGFPIVVLSRTGAGGNRPLVDRGVEAVHGGPPLAPGTGPALNFAQAGFAGASIDGPHGGLRNVTQGDEQFLMFNVGNPEALRDNVRQSAVELALEAHIVEGLTLDATDCPGVGGPVKFDPATMALMGHSMGATITPLTMAAEPRYRALILSGAGGSMIENIIYKKSPLPVKGIAEVLLGLAGSGYSLSEHDPLLSMFQWAIEPSDPPVYDVATVRAPAGGEPRHVLMLQGIVDTYILPPIANATTLSLGLDLAGEELDRDDPRLAGMTPIGDLLDLAGRKAIALPASGNVELEGGARATAVVVQHLEDGIEDGHEIAFQKEPPKHQYRCFLEGLAAGGGAPLVPVGAAADSPCE